VQERLAVVKEVDPPERRPNFVHHTAEDAEVEGVLTGGLFIAHNSAVVQKASSSVGVVDD
jgi:hypothetical protein